MIDTTIETIKRLATENQELKYELAKVKPLLLMGEKLIHLSNQILTQPIDEDLKKELQITLDYFNNEFFRKKDS